MAMGFQQAQSFVFEWPARFDIVFDAAPGSATRLALKQRDLRRLIASQEGIWAARGSQWDIA